MNNVMLTRIVEVLHKARASGLKWPKIRLRTSDGRRVVLSVAGERAKFPGSINVTDGRPYGENKWYGRILTDGVWERTRADWMTPHLVTVVEILKEFNEDPARVGSMQGTLTGSCCFCGRHLETRESVSVGYGPICADKFGLPWGDTEGYEDRKAEVFDRCREDIDDDILVTEHVA